MAHNAQNAVQVSEPNEPDIGGSKGGYGP
ncbi:uncharacterized protein G2W53_038483 [Senna tora]|uniref:Uncharacterized protein n=1 Tax=Senna tora TaxID=362788 RepID=A0A834SM36_9FABA|nr:uncharacterized protein G2W53_038483 [Senna tora]